MNFLNITMVEVKNVSWMSLAKSLLVILFLSSFLNVKGQSAYLDRIKELVPNVVYNYKLYEAVQVRCDIDERGPNEYPKANFKKYPSVSTKVDFSRLKRIYPGDILSDEILDLPLWVSNDALGRDTLTLRSEMDKEWLILDFWTEWCPPCLKSMNRWEKMVEEKPNDIVLLGAYANFPTYRAVIEARKKGYQSAQVVGASMAILKALFLGKKTYLGPSVWIKNGKLFGVSDAEKLSDAEYRGILSGQIKQIPEHAVYKGRQ